MESGSLILKILDFARSKLARTAFKKSLRFQKCLEIKCNLLILIGKLNFLNLYSSLTTELCKILQVKASATPKVIYFTNKNKVYLYEGPFKAKDLRSNFLSDDHGYLKHKLFSEDTADTV